MFDEDFAVHADGAQRQLDAIRAGGQRVVMLIRQEIGSALNALEEGDFTKLVEKLSRANSWGATLANAQQYIAIAHGSKLVLAADVEVGMVLTDVGEVSDVTIEDCASRHCRRHIEIKVGEHELRFSGDQEVYVNDPEQEEVEA